MIDGVSLMPTTIFVPHTGSLFDDSHASGDIRDLLLRPGVRLVMPSEESEDFITGIRYHREFDRARLTPRGDNDTSHKTYLTTYGRVFVNSVAEPYMKNEHLRFPAGSLVVREKLAKPHDLSPDVVSVMLKHGRGFNPLTNDWEFLLISERMSKIERGKATASCAVCHANTRHSDFLFKSYLPGR